METWHKVTLPFAETGISGKGSRLQKAFEADFMANKAPKDAALFTSHDVDFRESFFYFSPGAVRISKSLIDNFRGTMCQLPLPADSLRLLVGHSGAVKTLL
jgi:hypothetical protein